MKTFSWSYTALTQFETCPWQYYQCRVAKNVPFQETEATRWGNRVHKAMEQRLVKGEPLPEGMRHWEPYVVKIEKTPGDLLVEQKIALTRNLTETAWFANDVWVRAVFDVAILNGDKGVIIDWKTGNRRFSQDQLRLFAGVAMARYDLENIHTGYIWLKDKQTDVRQYSRRDWPAIWSEFRMRTKKIEDAIENDDFPCKTSGLCHGWCPVGPELCEHWRKR